MTNGRMIQGVPLLEAYYGKSLILQECEKLISNIQEILGDDFSKNPNRVCAKEISKIE